MDGHRRGQLLDGRYRIEDTLGEGGMGYVVRARHVELGQPVAIKLMRPDVSPLSAQRFLREARAASRIASDHVAKVFDVGRLEDGAPYMVMELLEGRDLGAILEQEGALPLAEAVTYARQTCRALAAAHALGIVHRDVKPENLFLADLPDGGRAIKLLDFGVSKEAAVASERPSPLTSTQTVLGSPQFMSPEQLVNCRDVDQRADLWSLGATLFELLTLEHAFPADTLAELYTKILRDPPRRLRELLPQASGGLEAVIARCLEKRPEDRFDDAETLDAALAHVAAGGEATHVLAGGGAIGATAAGQDEPSLELLGCEEMIVPEDHTPIATVRPVVHAGPAPAPKRSPWAVGLGATFAVVWLMLAAISAVRMTPDTALALSPAVPVVLAPTTLKAPAATTEARKVGPDAKDPSRFMDSVPLPEDVRAKAESSLALSTEALEGGDLDAAAARAREVLALLDKRGIRPKETISSVGAQAALLLGHVEADKLRVMLETSLTRRHEGEAHLQALNRQMALVRAAYGRVRSWNVQSFYRCAVVETAALDLSMGQLFAEAVEGARWSDRRWFVKAASARLRNARLEFRQALDMRTETMLCVDEARAGYGETKRAIGALPKIR